MISIGCWEKQENFWVVNYNFSPSPSLLLFSLCDCTISVWQLRKSKELSKKGKCLCCCDVWFFFFFFFIIFASVLPFEFPCFPSQSWLRFSVYNICELYITAKLFICLWQQTYWNLMCSEFNFAAWCKTFAPFAHLNAVTTNLTSGT